MNKSELSPEIEKYINERMEYRNRTGVLSEEECQSILKYAAENESDAVFGIGYYYFAEYYWYQDDTEKTMYCLTECSKCFRTARMHELLARAYNMMGAVSDSQGNRVAALNDYYTGLQYAERYHLPYVVGMLEMNIAYILMRMKRYQEAQEHYGRAMGGYRQAQDNSHLNLNLTDCMLHCGHCCLKQGEKEQAYRFLNRIDQIRSRQPGKAYSDAEIEVFRGECLAAQGERQEALRCVGRVIAAIDSGESFNDVSNSLPELAELLMEQEDYELLGELFERVKLFGRGKEDRLSEYLFPYQARYLLHEHKTEEYRECIGDYVATYEKIRWHNRQVTARVMELQDRLRGIEQEQKRMKDSNRKLESLALYDSMTGLANRTLIHEYVTRRFEEAQADGKLFAIELLDIDYFKDYNDTYGHLAGDSCIEAVAAVLQEQADDRIFCGRYGGDEFMVVYSDMTAEEIEETLCRIQSQVREKRLPHKKSGCSTVVTVSQGVFMSVPDSESREWDFNSMADAALYAAKRAGRNCYHIQGSFQQR